MRAGTSNVDSVLIQNASSAGVVFEDTGSGLLSNIIIRNSDRGIYIQTGQTSLVTIMNATIYGMTYAGVAAFTPYAGSPFVQVDVTNSIVAKNSHGISRSNGFGTLIMSTTFSERKDP